MMRKFFSGTRRLTAIIVSVAVLSALCITCFGVVAAQNSTPYIVAAKNSKIKVDDVNKLIIGVRRGTNGLSDYVEVGGDGRLVFSTNGVFTKDTTITLYTSSYVWVDAYSIVFMGDVNRDGTVDGTDVSAISNVVKFATTVDANSVTAEIMDINCDGVIDVQDLHLARGLSKGLEIEESISHSQQHTGGIDEDYWGDL